MFSTSFRNFFRDESGAYTVWSLIWFSLYVAMGGLAVDMTNAYRNQTLLQATADASALAGAMSLPVVTDVEAQALAYATANMDQSINGNVLDAADVVVGNWDFATRTFASGAATAPAVEAVLVTTRRSDANANPLATNFLRIMSLWGVPFDRWDINTEAIAVKYIPECRRGGLVSYNFVDVSSGNGFHNEICIHGQNYPYDSDHQNMGVDLNNNNQIDPGVTIGTPDLSDVDYGPNNTGVEDALTAQNVWPTDAMQVANIIDSLEAFEIDYMPDAVLSTNAGGVTSFTNLIERVTPATFPAVLAPNTVYEVTCGNPSPFSLPSGIPIKDVAIITNCSIHGTQGGAIENALIASSAVGNGQDPTDNHAIDLNSDQNIGSGTYCSSGGEGGVQMYALASIHVAAKLKVSGLRAVVGGDFQITAQADIEGISVEAMDEITATSGGSFGLCPNGTDDDNVITWNYRLVK